MGGGWPHPLCPWQRPVTKQLHAPWPSGVAHLHQGQDDGRRGPMVIRKIVRVNAVPDFPVCFQQSPREDWQGQC